MRSVADHPFGAPFSDVPATVPNLVLWLRADQEVFLSGSSVTSWKSLEGNSYGLTQDTASKQPTYLATSSLGSKPALQFDGSDLLVHPSAVLGGTTGTLYVVARMSSLGSGFPAMFSSSDQASGNHYCTFYSYGDVTHDRMGFSQKDNDIEDGLRGATATVINRNYFFRYSTNGSTVTMQLNGNTETVSAFGGANNGDWFGDTANRDNTVVGCRKITSELDFFFGEIAEIVAFSPELDASDKTTMQNYLNSRYPSEVTIGGDPLEIGGVGVPQLPPTPAQQETLSVLREMLTALRELSQSQRMVVRQMFGSPSRS